MDNEVKEMIDSYVENYYYEGFPFDEDKKKTIYKVFENLDLDDFFNLCDSDVLDKYEKEDSDEIFRYYLEKLCDYCDLDYRLANNRVDYVVYPKENV